jgi:hypothetical protein
VRAASLSRAESLEESAARAFCVCTRC